MTKIIERTRSVCRSRRVVSCRVVSKGACCIDFSALVLRVLSIVYFDIIDNCNWDIVVSMVRIDISIYCENRFTLVF